MGAGRGGHFRPAIQNSIVLSCHSVEYICYSSCIRCPSFFSAITYSLITISYLRQILTSYLRESLKLTTQEVRMQGATVLLRHPASHLSFPGVCSLWSARRHHGHVSANQGGGGEGVQSVFLRLGWDLAIACTLSTHVSAGTQSRSFQNGVHLMVLSPRGGRQNGWRGAFSHVCCIRACNWYLRT